MHKSTRTALIAIAILLCVIVVIVLLNLTAISTLISKDCVKLDGGETCYAKEAEPYRLYGTKTVYGEVNGKNTLSQLNVKGCVPKVFYLFCRHATRYPDKDDINKMIKFFPILKEKILNNSVSNGVKMCKEDLQNLKNWNEQLKPDFDNKMSETGENETLLLAQRFQAQFPTLLGGDYSPEKFVFEFTSRERTKATAESFAEGLFGKKIYFDDDDEPNDMLQFHKECKTMQKNCKDKSSNLTEIENFQNGTLMQQVINSISTRIGVSLTYDEIKLIGKACAFGYALKTGDTWCSLFSKDELKVLEFDDDIDDYYKDAYGNKINFKQACPVVEILMDLFGTFNNTSESKALMQFSHAGGIKKVYSLFGLFEDEEPLKADSFCSQQNRKWRSSYIAPFTTNLAIVLYECDMQKKIAAFHNEIPIKLDGCSEILCPYDEFYKKYNPISENCDLKKICCTCCQN